MPRSETKHGVILLHAWMPSLLQTVISLYIRCELACMSICVSLTEVVAYVIKPITRLLVVSNPFYKPFYLKHSLLDRLFYKLHTYTSVGL